MRRPASQELASVLMEAAAAGEQLEIQTTRPDGSNERPKLFTEMNSQDRKIKE